MQASLARHDEILSNAIEERGGYVFKTVGDAFCAAFPTAPDALEAVITAQRLLYAGGRDEEAPLRVRMALHTGAAEERGGDYFGPPLNRVARLLSAGRGGQILLSLATQELVRDQLPAGAGLRDLGEHAHPSKPRRGSRRSGRAGRPRRLRPPRCRPGGDALRAVRRQAPAAPPPEGARRPAHLRAAQSAVPPGPPDPLLPDSSPRSSPIPRVGYGWAH
jgi:class 3 adenylate cyclase